MSRNREHMDADEVHPAKYVIPSAYETVPVKQPKIHGAGTHQKSLISGRSKIMADQNYRRKILAVFPPTQRIGSSQFRFICRRFGIVKPNLTRRVADACAINEDEYDCVKLKNLILSAMNNEGTDLAKRLHRTVAAALANDQTRQGIATCNPEAFPMSPKKIDIEEESAVRLNLTKRITPDDEEPDSEMTKTERPRQTTTRRPGYLPEFYDKVDRNPPPRQKKVKIRRTGLV